MPCPRNVTLSRMTMLLDRLYVPAFRETTWPAGQEAMALLICAGVAPGLRVEQMVVRLGIPPITPAVLQSVARVGATMPIQGVAAKATALRDIHNKTPVNLRSFIATPLRPQPTHHVGGSAITKSREDSDLRNRSEISVPRPF